MRRPDNHLIECPKCHVATLRTARPPHFDYCGLETYELLCLICDASFVGIIDPSDDELVLSVRR